MLTGVTVVFDGSNVSKSTVGGTCFATIRFGSDGDEYENGTDSSATANSLRGTYLLSGLNSEVWIERTVTLGTLDTDPGAGRQQMTSDFTCGIETTTTKFTAVTFTAWDAASGGNQLDSESVTLSASTS